MKAKTAKIKIDEQLCKGCALCVLFCPKGLLEIDKKKVNAKGRFVAKVKAKGCTGCLSCALICPEAAIEVYK